MECLKVLEHATWGFTPCPKRNHKKKLTPFLNILSLWCGASRWTQIKLKYWKDVSGLKHLPVWRLVWSCALNLFDFFFVCVCVLVVLDVHAVKFVCFGVAPCLRRGQVSRYQIGSCRGFCWHLSEASAAALNGPLGLNACCMLLAYSSFSPMSPGVLKCLHATVSVWIVVRLRFSVPQPPTITLQSPKDYIFDPRENIVIHCEAKGKPHPR